MIPKDLPWLRDGIARALNWDAETAEGVAQAIASEESSANVDTLLEDYCGSHVDVVALVHAYRDSQHQAAKPVQHQKVSTAPASAAPQRVDRQGEHQRGFAVTTLRGAAAPRGSLQDSKQLQAGAPAILEGLRVKRTTRKALKNAAEEPIKVKPVVERPTCNCLGCGKIYDCRGTMSADSVAFVESGGVCTFCDLKVALNERDRSETWDMRAMSATPSATSATPPATSAAAKEAPEAKGASEADDTGEKAAIAFKDRLVAADRDGAKRTAVLDDQADFFEIDSNAWLSEEEKRSIRERQKAMVPDADEQRRNRFSVSFDMLGRQVILSDEPEDKAEAGGCISDSAAATSDAAAAASAATAQEIPQGGGTSALAAAAAAASLRIPRNPNLLIQPMFVRPPPKPERPPASLEASLAGDSRDGKQSTASAARRGSQGKAPGKTSIADLLPPSTVSNMSAGRALLKKKGRRQLPRLQHDDPTSAAIAPEN